MDIVTQGILGASLARVIASKEQAKIATAVGFFAGLLADADILIQSSSDPLLYLEYHRHFSHSIFFIPLGALIASLILWFFLRNRLNFSRLYLYCLAGYSLSGVIDACTSYGTQLFWPFASDRVALNIISIIDPAFTLILLVSLLLSIKKRSMLATRIGLLLAACYLGFGWLQLERARDMSRQLAADRGHEIQRLLVKPTLGNLLLWRSIYLHDERLYVDAVRVGIFAHNLVYPGNSIALFDVDSYFHELSKASTLYSDIKRFNEFSDNYVAILPDNPALLADIRYSVLPDSLRPLWGIQMDVQQPEAHAQYKIIRDMSADDRKRFVAMLLGKPLETSQ